MIISSDSVTIEVHNYPKQLSSVKDSLEDIVIKFKNYFEIKEIFSEISFISKEEIKEINKKFRNKDKATNVLTFPSQEIKRMTNNCHGEILVCMEVIEQESLDQDKKIENHFFHLLIHSFLHLLGYMHDKEDDAILMESREIEFLANIGVDNPYK